MSNNYSITIENGHTWAENESIQLQNHRENTTICMSNDEFGWFSF